MAHVGAAAGAQDRNWPEGGWGVRECGPRECTSRPELERTMASTGSCQRRRAPSLSQLLTHASPAAKDHRGASILEVGLPTDIGNIGLPGDELPTPPAPAVSLPQLSMDAAPALEPALAADPAPPMADLAIDVETDLAVHVELMDLGLEPLSPPGVAAVQVTVDVLGELFVGAAVPLSMDDDDLLSLNERHAIRLPEARGCARVAEALGGADEDSDVFFVVHAVDDFDSGEEQGKELGSAHLNLRSLATEEAGGYDATLEHWAGQQTRRRALGRRAHRRGRARAVRREPAAARRAAAAGAAVVVAVAAGRAVLANCSLAKASRDAAALSTSGAGSWCDRMGRARPRERRRAAAARRVAVGPAPTLVGEDATRARLP